MPKHQNYIAPETDDRLYEGAMFDKFDSPNYLGNPAVVGKLVADYCQKVRDELAHRAAGTQHAEGFVAEILAERDRLAAIFSGQDPAYEIMDGWNNRSLPIRLKVELGEYWQKNREANDEDPLKTLFAWLCWAVFDAVKTAHGDHDLEAEILAGRTRSAIQLLLGTAGRA